MNETTDCYRCGLPMADDEPGLLCFLSSEDGKYIRITHAHIPPCPRSIALSDGRTAWVDADCELTDEEIRAAVEEA
jgi:hypothetical protein